MDPKAPVPMDPKASVPPDAKASLSLDPKTLPAPAPQLQSPPTALPNDVMLDPDAGQSNENPTGRQEPAVSLEWVGPSIAKVGQSVTYQIIVKNISPSRVHQVIVRNRVPPGVTVSATEPKATTEGNLLSWNLGTMEPRQEQRLDLQLVPAVTGNVTCHAFVTLTGSSTARLEVHEPKLALKATAPAKVVTGDPATVMLTVSNPGDATADFVKVKAVLSEGLEHANGKTVDFDLGSLAPKESRTVLVLCGAKGVGEQRCEAVATAEPKLTAQDTATIECLTPRVDLAVSGPGMRYLDRHAIYTFKVTNPGTAPANHVTLADQIPLGFKVVAASGGGRHDFVSRTVSWFIGDLGPGQSKEVSLELVAINPGEHKNKASVTAARGLRAENEIVTRVEGLPALLMELVDLDDPLEVGAETSYEIRVTNTGTKTETNVELVCTIPDKMEFRGAKGAAGCKYKVEGKEVIFEVLPKLAPRADAIYRVSVRGLAAGDLRFQARLKADGLTAPVLKEESTRVYGDEVEPRVEPVPGKQ
jgi:uncharacterized repeat protein (TIGR01451 family)